MTIIIRPQKTIKQQRQIKRQVSDHSRYEKHNRRHQPSPGRLIVIFIIIIFEMMALVEVIIITTISLNVQKKNTFITYYIYDISNWWWMENR